MRGITGAFDTTEQMVFDRRVLDRMSRSPSHRDRDANNFYREPGAGFGRLYIIDVATGWRSALDTDRTEAVGCNGEIHSYTAAYDESAFAKKLADRMQSKELSAFRLEGARPDSWSLVTQELADAYRSVLEYA